MDNLIFALNTTMPVFILMLLGAFFKKINWMDETFASKLNKFVFRIPLPLLVFKDLAVVDIRQAWDTKFVLFCAAATVLSILAAWAVSLLFDRDIRGEFVQGAYRSSAALLGIALIANIYGSSTTGPLMIVGSVPLYNIAAVTILTVMKPGAKGEERRLSGALIRETLLGILKNPILIGIEAGLVFSLFRIPCTGIFQKVVNNISATATPLGLMAMGAAFDMKKATGKLLPAATASFIKLFGFCLIFLPLAVLCGFREAELIAILVMLGSATTVSSYVMARNMGHEGTLASSVVMLTTLFAAFSLTFWLWLLKVLQLI